MKNLKVYLTIGILGFVLLMNVNKVDLLCPPQKFEEVLVSINSKYYTFYKAQSECQIKEGLGDRLELKTDGMIFIFPTIDHASFYLRKTLLPLSIAYIDESGTILEIQHSSPNLSSVSIDLYSSKSNHVKYAIHAFYGFFDKNNIKVGDKVIYE